MVNNLTIAEQFKILETLKKDGSLNKKGFTWRSVNQISKDSGLGIRKVIMTMGLCADLLLFNVSDKDGKLLVKYNGE